ncbi:response regulator, partial [bacterium]|nr:response regulator [bacterium]
MKNPKRPTLLIVDDEPNNIRILSDLLKEDCQILFAKNGLKAIELAKTKLPDLVILDIMMPEMDGYEVCERLKLIPETKDIPVVFATAMNEIQDEEKGLSLGALDYVTKPFQMAIVKRRILNHLELVKKRKQADQLLKNIL